MITQPPTSKIGHPALYHLAGLCLSVLVVLGPHAVQAEEDAFAAMDALLDTQFNDIDMGLEEQYQRLDKAMEAAYVRLGAEVAQQWGDDEVKLPSKAVWVDYDESLSSRRLVDFEVGSITIERLVDPGVDPAKIIAAMTEAALSLSTDTMKTLASKDLALIYAREDLANQGIELPTPAPRETGPVLAGVTEPMDVTRMDELLRAALNMPPSKPKTTLRGQAKALEPELLAGIRTAVNAGPEQQRIVSIQIPLKKNHTTTLANKYFSAIAREADRQQLPPSLLLAVMETESHFNPRARSAVPAYGLMQLVPRSGAMDAYEALYGEKTLLDAEYLYKADNNVELGSAYLSILHNRYLRHISNEESRQYCVIAAYNTGAGNVAKAFTGDFNVRQAAKIINTMSPLEVYAYLRAELPYEETRHYVFKVTEAQKKYFAFDEMSATGASL